MVVDKSGRRVRAMFAQIARRYDLLNHLLSGGTDVYWRWRTARAVGRIADGPILDVCTGTGDLAFAFRRRLGDDAVIVGTDFTHEMLVLAQRKSSRFAESRGTAPVTFLEADAEALPFADGSFGVVSVAFGQRNVANTQQGLREMIRVCRPGGDVLILEFSRPEVPVLGSLYGWYFRNVLPRIGQMFARNQQSAYEYLPQSVGEFPSGKALAAIMERCGLSDVRCQPLTFGVCTLYRGRKRDAEASSDTALETSFAVAAS
jgi:demethylmenaquinone methyltransferase/2-methoxy-6-polyprenyl-1,4-benzoquinol methylase